MIYGGFVYFVNIFGDIKIELLASVIELKLFPIALEWLIKDNSLAVADFWVRKLALTIETFLYSRIVSALPECQSGVSRSFAINIKRFIHYEPFSRLEPTLNQLQGEETNSKKFCCLSQPLDSC